jgi:hypothetical protein
LISQSRGLGDVYKRQIGIYVLNLKTWQEIITER